jgi:GNAT superfamily N-acetyltransferase
MFVATGPSCGPGAGTHTPLITGPVTHHLTTVGPPPHPDAAWQAGPVHSTSSTTAAPGAAGPAVPEAGPAELELVDTRYDSAAVQELVEEVQAEYVRRYGGPDVTPLAPEEFAPPHGAFLLGRLGGLVVGCVGLRGHESGVAELKRLYVRAEHRRRGHARRLLAAAEERARELGHHRVVLETGTEQPEALAMYRAEGYLPVEPFGHYACSASSHHLGKDL